MANNAVQPTFFFHDYETFGTHPGKDRPAQFAGIRTDADLNPVGEPLMIYCRMSPDYLPDPAACLITGITPQTVNRHGLSEAEFCQQIHAAFSAPGTCIVGYNNIRFDDEFTRYSFYRNYIDPYEYSWKEGNSRWDLLAVVRACYALRPEGINWVFDEEGKPSFRLEKLTVANEIGHQHAHDALSDVYATIGIAKLIKERQPRLFDYLFQHRGKHKLRALIDLDKMTPLVHISGMFSAWQGCASFVAPVVDHPTNQNAVVQVDLARDITPLIELDVDTLRERLYTRHDELGDALPIPIKLVHLNKCPILAPAKTLTETRADELGIDRAQCRKSYDLLRQHHAAIRAKLTALYESETPFEAPAGQEAELRLYDGFLSPADRNTATLLRDCPPEQITAERFQFNDERYNAMLFRYRARNFPHTLNADEQQQWQRYCRERIESQADAFVLRLELLLEQHAEHSGKVDILRALAQYLQSL